jgi:hypothetical protein
MHSKNIIKPKEGSNVILKNNRLQIIKSIANGVQIKIFETNGYILEILRLE